MHQGSIISVSCLTLLLCAATQQVSPAGGKAGCMGSGVMLTARSEGDPGSNLLRSSEPTSIRSKKRGLDSPSLAVVSETRVVIGG